MDLLSYNTNQASKIQKEIIDALSTLPIENTAIQTAKEFFDFSKEMDLGLLENVRLYEFDDTNYSHSTDMVYYLIRNTEMEYSDRYILFLDAIGANMIGGMLAYDCTRSYVSDGKFAYRLKHAYDRKYDSKRSKMKIIALLSQCQPKNIISQRLIAIAKSDANLLFETGKQDCKSQCAYAKLKLYALALAFTKPNEKQNVFDKVKAHIFDRPKNESIQEMTDTILDYGKQNQSSPDFMEFTVPVMFMAMNHSEKIEAFLKESIKGKELKFLAALYTNIPNSYFEQNADKVMELVNMEVSEGFVINCIKQAIVYAWRKNTNGYKAEYMLEQFAKKYPKQFIYVMSLLEEIKDTSVNYYAYSSSMQYYSSFYEQMYNILKKRNPKAIIDENVDFYGGLLTLAVSNEMETSNIAKEEIRQYLMGESDLSVLEPYFDTLANHFVHTGSRYFAVDKPTKSCVKNIPEFKKRYVAFKVIQCPALIESLTMEFYHDDYKVLIMDMIKEGVPTKFRFMLYDYIYDSFYTDKPRKQFEEIVLKRMIHFASKQEEYESVCLNLGVFSRKMYVRFLDETNQDDKNSERIFAMLEDTSKEIRKEVVGIVAKHKNNEEKVLNLLKAKKLAVREAAVDILAAWGIENYKDILLEMTETEKSKRLVEKIQTLLSVNVGAVEDKDGRIISPLTIVDELHKGGRSRQLAWLYTNMTYTTVHFNSGSEVDEKYLQAIMLCYATAMKLGVSDNANLLVKELKQDELNQFAYEIFSKWVSEGAEAKKKWVLYFSLIHGGYNMQEVILHYIKEWSEASRGAIASEAVRALAMNGSSEALMTVDNIAHKFKHKQVKNAALQALDSAADELGITTDELGDRIVPDLGFDENMQRIFDYGTRKFKVYLTPALEIEVFDENDKKLKSMPAPAKKDDEETAKKSNTEFKQMKKQLKNVIAIQKLRLETALLADRRWQYEAWINLFVKNPVMHSFAIGLVWCTYIDDKPVQTFRYMEDGTFNTYEEDEYELPENCTIGLVHPIDLDEETLSAWKEQLSDYEIIQPIEQLDRQVYRVTKEEIGKKTLERFHGRKINDFTLIGRMTKLGWLKGDILDAGGFSVFYREDIVKRVKDEKNIVKRIGNAVAVEFSGTYVAGVGEEVEIEGIRFYNPENVKRDIYGYVEEKYSLRLDNISPRYFSEIINQLETILKVSE